MVDSSNTPLVVHVIYALRTGGLENGLVNIVNRMPADRYRHAIICLTDAGEFAERITAKNIQIIELHKRPGHDFGLYWRFFLAIRKLRPAIVHTRNLTSLELQIITRLFYGIKTVHGEHGRDIRDLHGTNRKYNLLRKSMAPFIHRYIAVSQNLADWLVDVVGIRAGKVRQIYNGVDHQKFNSITGFRPSDNVRSAPQEFYFDHVLVVGTVGRLAEVKNQKSLLLALKLLFQADSTLRDRVRLLIVGDGPKRRNLEQTAVNLGLQDVVWFPGDRKDIPDLLNSMNIFVLPSLGEGISNTILEAMACELPVVASDVGGNPELVIHNQNGLLVPVDDAKALADALMLLAKDNSLRVSMSKKSAEIALDKFDWNKTVQSYMAVYDQLLSGS